MEPSNLILFEEFASSNSFYNTIKNVSEYVVPEIVCKSLFINNLPLEVTKEEILKMLEIFNLNESNLIIDEKMLNNFGCLIATFPNEDDAELAKNFYSKYIFEGKNRNKKLNIENLLLLINKGNES